MVVPTMGTATMLFLASSTPLRIASGTSPALPRPKPTRPAPSPTTTSALKEKRRPPLTTLATRLTETMRSWRSLLPPRSSRRLSIRIAIALKLQSRFAGGVGQRLDAAVVEIAAPVEDHGAGPGLARALGDGLAHGDGGVGVGGDLELLAQVGLVGRGRGQGDALRVVDHLRRDVVQAAEDRQPRTLRGSGDALPHPDVPAITRGAAVVLGEHLRAPYFAFPALPDLPALRRSFSPR